MTFSSYRLPFWRREVVRKARTICVVLYFMMYSTVVWVLLHNIAAHNVNVTGRVCYLFNVAAHNVSKIEHKTPINTLYSSS